MKSKTIIISSPDNDSQRGILTITEEPDLLRCKLRLYNIDHLSSSCHLGIYHKDQVYTANIINRGSYYESSLAGDFDMSQDFYSAIVDTSNNNHVLLAGGTYAGFYYDDHSIFSNESHDETSTDPEIAELIDHELDQADQCTDCDRCANCHYKEYFYAHQTPPEPQPTPEPTPAPATPDILSQLMPQFDYIFANYPENTELNRLIPNSRFVSIPDDRSYSLGAIYDHDNISYICYATRCNYNTPAPDELGQHYQWLPLDPQDPLSEGYYIVYQDAHDLKIVEI